MDRTDNGVTPRITVALPVYNVEKYIRECLESVINQTMSDIEIICVNDASTDGSMDIVYEYAKNDNRFLIINKEHEGLSVSRNVSIDAARGEYIYFLDCDDYIALNTLELLYSTAVSHDLDVLYFDGLAVFEDESLKTQQMYESVYIKQCPKSGVLTGQQLLAHFTSTSYKVHMCMQFFKLKFLKDSGIRCFPGIIHQDELFTSMCICVATRVQYIKDILFYRRLREFSTITALNKEHSFYSIMTVIVEFLRFMDAHAIGPAARNILALKMKTWVDRAIDRYRELEKKINLDEMFIGDPLKNYIFNAAVLPQIIKYIQPRDDNQELKAIKNSLSFKIGRALTYLPRRIARLLGVSRS
jgi:glycosyltransferase involved in cell wall biosynthesis